MDKHVQHYIVCYFNMLVMHVARSGMLQFCEAMSYLSTGPQLNKAPTPLKHR